MNHLQSLSSFEDKNTPGKENTFTTHRDSESGCVGGVGNSEGSPTIKSLEALGSNLFAERKLSAFSIYSPLSEEHSDRDHNEVSIDFLSQPLEKVSSINEKNNEKCNQKEQSRVETKNLNRFFRSKLNEMLRDIRDNQTRDEKDSIKAAQLLTFLNKSNKIMFKEIREVIGDPWLQDKFANCRCLLLKYVHKGKMGMQSKLIMLKYFNKILRAIKNPQFFHCWK